MDERLEKACKFALNQAYSAYIKDKCGYCAKAIREAVEFGFDLKLTRTLHAKDYGPSYEKIGFKKILSTHNITKYKPQIGDIAIIIYQPSGHICIFAGECWVSDFKQWDIYGGPKRKERPLVEIYRLY